MTFTRPNRACFGMLALVAAAGATSPTAAQLYQATLYESKCQFNLGIPSNWSRTEGRWFGHSWARSCNQWWSEDAAWSPWGQSGQPSQAPNFAPYGLDTLLPVGAGAVNNGSPSPLPQCFQANLPGSVDVPVQLGSQIFTGMGTAFLPGGVFVNLVTAHNGFVRGDGHSEFTINPYGPPYGASNFIDGTIRSFGGYTENSIFTPIERGYGFSFTELRASGTINPQYHPPIVWGSLFCISAGATLPPPPAGGATFSPGPPGQPSYSARRVYDPIRYTVTDTVTGLSISGVAVSMYIDVGPASSANAQNGMMSIGGSDVSVRIEMTDPRVSPQGTYELDIRNGVVVASSSSGVFASQSPPPIGSATPLSFAFPSSYPFSLDLNGFSTNPMEVQMVVNNAGLEPVPELTCAKISLEPTNTTVCDGADAALFVGANGTGALTHQWQRGDGLGNWWPVFDGTTPGGSAISGSQSATLSISASSLMDAGVYNCIITDICATVTSQPATLSVTVCAPPCYANCDGSAGIPMLTANDFQCFMNNFAQGNAYANCDGSTAIPMLTGNDFQCFINAYASGCS